MALDQSKYLMPIERTDIPEDLAVELQIKFEKECSSMSWAFVDDPRYGRWVRQQQDRQRAIAEQRRQQASDAKR